MAYERRIQPSSTRARDDTSVQESPPPPPPPLVGGSTPVFASTFAPAWIPQDMMGAFTAFMGFMKQQATGGGIPVGQPVQQDQMGVMEKVLKKFHKQNPQTFRGTANEP
ncbi:hypothetical protein NE237_005744 [Protea cynaroides]|uniref:Uncharacterized protein n=1 Tax=Protea cynaroides TaxID=273540 RepID=A0A9Q0QUS8_9MAGN|nr:hypothetical protein NE237_005744 [Protea cynaroides]